MSSWGFAPKVTRLTFSAADVAVLVENGEPVRVWGFIVSNKTSTSETLVIRTNESSPVTLFHLLNAGNDIYVHYTPFIADKGLNVIVTGGTSPTSQEIVFFHSHPGS